MRQQTHSKVISSHRHYMWNAQTRDPKNNEFASKANPNVNIFLFDFSSLQVSVSQIQYAPTACNLFDAKSFYVHFRGNVMTSVFFYFSFQKTIQPAVTFIGNVQITQ